MLLLTLVAAVSCNQPVLAQSSDGPGGSLLERAGFDPELFENLHQYSDAAITPEEGPMFAELLRSVEAIDRIPPNEAEMDELPAADLVELARRPSAHAGELLRVEGMLRRITPVEWTADASAGSGDRYWQLDVFLPLGHQTIVIETDDGEGQVEVHGSYGVTVLLHDLPASIDEKELPVQVSVPAFFLKIWEHKTMSTRRVSPDLRRPNPVFVGLPGELTVVTAGAAGTFSWWIPAFWTGLGVVLLATLLLTAQRRSSWRDRKRSLDGMAPDWSALQPDDSDRSGIHP
jgi:hypothetical protein